MYKTYFKQAIYTLKKHPLLSAISILGTALAICMIMIVMILYEAHTADLPPEVNRDRSYIVPNVFVWEKATNERRSYSFLGHTFVKECFYPLSTAEAVTAVFNGNLLGYNQFTSPMDNQHEQTSHTIWTDPSFWHVFQFHFVDGRPFSEEEFTSGIHCVVITETLSRKMFGTEKAVGKEMKIGLRPYTITGVVRDVSRFADRAYAEIWLPYTSLEYIQDAMDGINGSFQCTIILKNGIKPKELKDEITNKISIFNSKTSQYEARIHPPFNQIEHWLIRPNLQLTDSLTSIFFRYGILLFVLLLVPALNLSGITLSQMQKRLGELGVRRAFGAKSRHLLGQVIAENAVQTLLGGFFGLILSYLTLYLLREWLLANSLGQAGLTINMFNGMVFLYAFLFCMTMNLLSAGIPAWKVSHAKIIDSLNAV